MLRSTETGEQAARAGDDFAPKGEPAPSSMVPSSPQTDSSGGGKAAGGDFADLDFLADASAVLTNYSPKDGVVKINRKEIGPHAMIHVVAVDPLSTTYRSTHVGRTACEVPISGACAMADPAGHFTQQKQVSVLPPRSSLFLADAAAGRFEGVRQSAQGLFALRHAFERSEAGRSFLPADVADACRKRNGPCTRSTRATSCTPPVEERP